MINNVSQDLMQNSNINVIFFVFSGISALFYLVSAILFNISFKLFNLQYDIKNTVKSLENKKSDFYINLVFHWLVSIFIVAIMITNSVLLSKCDLGLVIMIFNMVCLVVYFLNFINLVNIINSVPSKQEDVDVVKDDIAGKKNRMDVAIVIVYLIALISSIGINLSVIHTYGYIYGFYNIVDWISSIVCLFYIVYVAVFVYKLTRTPLLICYFLVVFSTLSFLISCNLAFTDSVSVLVGNVSIVNSVGISNSTRCIKLMKGSILLNNVNKVDASVYDISNIANNVYVNSTKYGIKNQLLYTIIGKEVIVSNSDNLVFLYDENNNVKGIAISVDDNLVIMDDMLNFDVVNYSYHFKNFNVIPRNAGLNDKMDEYCVGFCKYRIDGDSLIENETSKVVGVIKDGIIYVDTKKANVLTLGNKITSIDGLFINDDISNFANRKIMFYYMRNDNMSILNMEGKYE